MSRDRRALHRIPNQHGSDLVAHLVISDKSIPAAIYDFNSISVSLDLRAEDMFLLIQHPQIRSLSLKLGELTIGSVLTPKVLRLDNDLGRVVILLQTNTLSNLLPRDNRTDIPDGLQGFCTARDPLRINELLHFHFLDVSPKGLLLKSSKSNRHLLPGLKLEKIEIILPNAGVIQGTATLKHAYLQDKNLVFGCEFQALHSHQNSCLEAYHYLCLSAMNAEEAKTRPSSRNLHLRNFIRIERVSHPTQFEQVLRVRFESYKKAQKISAEIKDHWQMQDPFDDQSMILAALFGTKVVGTVRLVFPKEGGKFPFEEYFTLPDLDRDDLLEVSKLAILPEIQGHDVILKLFQGFAAEYIPKKRYAICMATQKLSPHYTAIGAKKISHSIPHPYLPGETLACYLFDRERLEMGKMHGTAWYLFARDVIDHLSHFGVTKKPQPSIRLSLLRMMEGLYLKWKRKKQS